MWSTESLHQWRQQPTTATNAGSHGRCAAASCGALLPAPRPRVLRRWCGGALPARREPRQSVCVQLPCWISSSAVARRPGRKSVAWFDRRARTGRVARPRSTKKIIARRKQTNLRKGPVCGAGAELRRGRHLRIVMEVDATGQVMLNCGANVNCYGWII